MDYLLSDDEWAILSKIVDATAGDSRARRAMQACLYRYSGVQLARAYRSFGWECIPKELGIHGQTANRRFKRWSDSGELFQFWDALLEHRHGKKSPEKPSKHLSENPLKALISELERAYRFFNQRFTAGELPSDIVISVEGRVPGARGYLSPELWSVSQNDHRHHLAVSIRTIKNDGVNQTLATLLHEMAHLRNVTLGVSDTRADQYHRQDFRDTARLFGLSCDVRAVSGYFSTTLADRGCAAIAHLNPVEQVFQWVTSA